MKDFVDSCYRFAATFVARRESGKAAAAARTGEGANA